MGCHAAQLGIGAQCHSQGYRGETAAPRTDPRWGQRSRFGFGNECSFGFRRDLTCIVTPPDAEEFYDQPSSPVSLLLPIGGFIQTGHTVHRPFVLDTDCTGLQAVSFSRL